MSNLFTVWYVLSVVVINDKGTNLDSALAIHKDLESCQHAAQRVIAAAPSGSAKWACHEMTVSTKGGYVYVEFPNN